MAEIIEAVDPHSQSMIDQSFDDWHHPNWSIFPAHVAIKRNKRIYIYTMRNEIRPSS
jgi:hypothetical protein